MKYKYCNIDNLIPLTSLQIDIYISLVRHSDERFALVRGVYYKDISEEVKCCNQSFYNSMAALKKHGVIKVSERKKTDLDYDVYICGNEYPDQDYSSEKYVNFNADVFYMDEFKNLKAHEKYLFLYLYQYTFRNAKGEDRIWKKNKKDFYDQMEKKLGVTKPVLRKYLHSLKFFYYIWTLNGNIYFKRKPVTNTETVKEKTEEEWMLEQYLVSECHRQRMDFKKSTVDGLINLLKAYRKNFDKNATLVVLGKMLSAMKESIKGLRPKDRELSGGYVNKIFCAAVMESESSEAPDMDILYNSEMLSLCM